jgi:hypothetical protein
MSSNYTNHFSVDDAALVLIDCQPQIDEALNLA